MEEPTAVLRRAASPSHWPVLSESPLRLVPSHTGRMELSSLPSEGPVARVRLLRKASCYLVESLKFQLLCLT